MIKTLNKEGIYLNLIKAIYDKPMANIVFNDEKSKSFPLKSGKYTNNGILCSDKKENLAICNNVDESKGHYGE